MDMAEHRVFLFIHFDNPIKKIFYAKTGFTDCRDDRSTDHACERFMIELIAMAFQLVVHIESDYHTHIHVDQLAGQVQVAFEVGCIDYVDDYVRLLFVQMFADVKFFRRVSRQRISPRQVYNLKRISVLMECSGFCIDCHATVVSDMFVRAGSKVE